MRKVPRSPENDKILKQIWDDQCSKKVLRDQMGLAFNEPAEWGIFDCGICGKPYILGQSLIHSPKTDVYYCEDCFRPLAEGALRTGILPEELR